jgi:hypothetical protein
MIVLIVKMNKIVSTRLAMRSTVTSVRSRGNLPSDIRKGISAAYVKKLAIRKTAMSDSPSLRLPCHPRYSRKGSKTITPPVKATPISS